MRDPRCWLHSVVTVDCHPDLYSTDTSEWSILVQPPGPLVSSGIQTIGALSGIAAMVVGVRASGLFGVIVGALGVGLFVTAVVLNGVLVANADGSPSSPSRLSEQDRRFHSLSLVNTLIGYKFSGLWRFVVVVFNAVLVITSVTAIAIRDELNDAWGCYSGSLPIERLTGLTCTLDDSPELCFHVGEPREYLGSNQASPDLPSTADAVACGPGSRHVSLQNAIWVPIGLFGTSWLLLVMWEYRHKDHFRLTPDEEDPKNR